MIIKDGGRKSLKVTGLIEIQKFAINGSSTIARIRINVGNNNKYANRFSRRASSPLKSDLDVRAIFFWDREYVREWRAATKKLPANLSTQ